MINNDDWYSCSLKDVLINESLPSGIYLDKTKYGSGNLIVKLGDVFALDIFDPEVAQRAQISQNQIKNYKLRKGDLIIALASVKLEGVGKVLYIDEIEEDIVYDHNVALLRAKDSVNSKFLSYLFKSTLIRNQVGINATQVGTTFLKASSVKNFDLVLPKEISEQQKIATALSDTDALISELEKLIEKKQAIKTATMQQLLTGKTRLPEFALREDGTPKTYKESELGQIPEDWEVVPLEKHIEKIIGGGTPSRSIASYWGQDIPWVTVKDFATFDPNSAQEYITHQGLKSSASNLIPAGTLITSTRMALGKALIYQVDVAINQDLKAIFTKSSLDTMYLKYWFDNNAKKIDDLGSGSTVKGISLPDLKTLSFIEMSLLEQLAIKNILVSIDKDLSLLKQRYEKTKSIKQGMMQELLTGKTRLV